MKRLIWAIIILLIIIFGIWFVEKKVSMAPSLTDEDSLSGENKINEEVSFNHQSSKITENTEVYMIDLEFPVLEDSYVSAQIDKYINETADQFKSDAQEFGPHPVAGRKYTLFTNYQFKESENYKTFVFLTSVDMGGAHPNHFFKTLTFDNLGNLVTISDLVQKEFGEENVFEKISEVVQSKLIEDLGDVAESSWIKDGAGPFPENFQDFYVEGDKIHFLFEPYAVAAYALGSREVTLSFDEIRD